MRFLIVGVTIPMTVLVGTSRVYPGVHWPTDVFAGWFLGAWAVLFWMIAMKSDPRGAETESTISTPDT